MSIQVIFSSNKFLAPLPGINLQSSSNGFINLNMHNYWSQQVFGIVAGDSS